MSGAEVSGGIRCACGAWRAFHDDDVGQLRCATCNTLVGVEISPASQEEIEAEEVEITTLAELHDFVDTEFAEVAKRAKRLSPSLDHVSRVGIVTGVLIKTGIKLAAKNSAPRAVIEMVIAETIREMYGN